MLWWNANIWEKKQVMWIITHHVWLGHFHVHFGDVGILGDGYFGGWVFWGMDIFGSMFLVLRVSDTCFWVNTQCTSARPGSYVIGSGWQAGVRILAEQVVAPQRLIDRVKLEACLHGSLQDSIEHSYRPRIDSIVSVWRLGPADMILLGVHDILLPAWYISHWLY